MKITFLSGLRAGQSEHFKGEITIGSGPDCKLRIDEPGVSYLHATFVEVEGNWYMEGCESSNGIFINGKKIKSSKYNLGLTPHQFSRENTSSLAIIKSHFTTDKSGLIAFRPLY